MLGIKKQLEATFQGKKVLITGHTGFKGGWLAIWAFAIGRRGIWGFKKYSGRAFFT